MDQEEERVLYLSRVGREKIFKYGTYTVTGDQKPITQDHPFYVKRDDEKITAPEKPVDAETLAEQVISNNFKVGLSQEEVDALLNGI